MPFPFAVRGVLGALTVFALVRFKRAAAGIFGRSVGTWFVLIVSSQFHLLFYASRTLPNTFALVLALLALAEWLLQGGGQPGGRTSIRPGFIVFSAAAVLVFRSELALLLGPMLLMDIAAGTRVQKAFKIAVCYGVLSVLLWVPLTVLVDSYFWGSDGQSWWWPEAQVFHFNVILNRSSEWGVMPWHWYLTSALPRAAMASLPLALPLAPLLDRRTLRLLLPCLIFVGAYSALPHKELRFVIYVLPLLDLSAALALHRLASNASGKGMFRSLLAGAAVAHLLANLLVTAVLLYTSSWNYPGGQALVEAHRHFQGRSSLAVYVDNLPAQTGVSRFLELDGSWSYDKTEGLSTEALLSSPHYDVLLLESKRLDHLQGRWKDTHKLLGSAVKAFQGVSFDKSTFPPVRLAFYDAIKVLEAKK